MDTADSLRQSPALEVRAGGLILTLAPARSYRIGRDPRSDVAVDDPRVSWRHAVLRMEQDRWLLEDLGSTNGTFLGPDRVRRVEITGLCQLRLGHPDDGQVVACSVNVPAMRRPPETYPPANVAAPAWVAGGQHGSAVTAGRRPSAVRPLPARCCGSAATRATTSSSPT